MRFAAALCALLAVPAAADSGASDWSWHQSLTPHFEIKHQMAFMPPGFSMSVERMHGKLRLDLAGFSPWMSKERLKLYLYKDRQAYASGEFQPPPWSNGISLYEKRVVAVYDQPNRKKLLEVLSHEATHLLFESYWGEVGRQPPSWINEGLAMIEEAEPDHPERSDWFRAMVMLPQMGYLHIDDLVKITPTTDLQDDKAKVEKWYVEAYSVTFFLLRKHSRLQFKNLCAKLREGKDLDSSLWLVYRYQGTKQLEKAWMDWLRDPKLKAKAEAQRVASAPGEAGGDDEESPAAKLQPKARYGGIKGFKPLDGSSSD